MPKIWSIEFRFYFSWLILHPFTQEIQIPMRVFSRSKTFLNVFKRIFAIGKKSYTPFSVFMIIRLKSALRKVYTINLKFGKLVVRRTFWAFIARLSFYILVRQRPYPPRPKKMIPKNENFLLHTAEKKNIFNEGDENLKIIATES